MADDTIKPVFKPMPGKIVAKVVGERDTYGKGLILKSPTRVNPRTTAEVVAVYEPFLLDNANPDSETSSYVQVGDIVVFGLHSGIEIEYGDEKVIILREQEILTKVVVQKPEDIARIGVEMPDHSDLDE
jgi:co-chaperonin GroES (HSP10)